MVGHFFAFFVAVFGELTPPTSITAEITSKIANTSFYVTHWRSVQICVSLFTLMVGVFVRPEVVAEPGLGQLTGALLIFVPTIGLTFSIQAIYSRNSAIDVPVRIFLAACSLFTLFYPDGRIAAIGALPVFLLVGYWLVWCRLDSVVREPEVPAREGKVQNPAE